MRYLLMFLMLCGMCYPTAVTYYLGGGSCNANAPYFHETAVAASACVGADGAPIYTGADADVGNATNSGDTNYILITLASGHFPAITAGTYAYVNFAATYTDGIYRVHDNVAHEATTIVIECTHDTVNDVDVDDLVVGGARSATIANLNATTLNTTTDYNVAAGTASTLAWATNQATVKVYAASDITCNASWSIGTGTNRRGAQLYPVKIIACDSSWNYSSQSVTLVPSADLANGLIYLDPEGNANYFTIIRGFELDCDDGGGNVADYGIKTDASQHSWLYFDDMVAHDAAAAGFWGEWVNYVNFNNCKAYGCVDGFSATTITRCAGYYNCTAYDNSANGWELRGLDVLVGCISQSNGADGYNLGTYGKDTFINCLAASNVGDGWDIANQTTNEYWNNFIGCVAYSNGAYGFNFVSDSPIGAFINNLAYDNTTNPLYNGSSRDATYFGTYGAGSLTSNPTFVDADGADNDESTGSDNDFTLASGSPLIGTGTNARTLGPTSHLTCSGSGSVSTGFSGGFDQ